MGTQENLRETIEERIREFDPDVELIALEQPSAGTLRLYIDRPGGVDLSALRVGHRRASRFSTSSTRWKSPRPATTAHSPSRNIFSASSAARCRVKTREAIDGQRNFNGTLASADDESVTVAAIGGTLVRIPFDGVERSNLVGELWIWR